VFCTTKPYLPPPEACVYLESRHGIKRKPSTLAKLRCIGGGPRFIKAGRAILYPPSELDEYASSLFSELCASTSEANPGPIHALSGVDTTTGRDLIDAVRLLDEVEGTQCGSTSDPNPPANSTAARR
jgi:hypothetical protein